jgi:hypothetical protein
MAYRKSKGKLARRSKKIEPAVMTLNIFTPSVSAGSTESFYCDLSQMASLVNRRFYRQGINWAVAGVKILTSSGLDGSVTTRKLPATWTMSNAWEKSMRTWLKQNNESMEETESIRPRFMDFKIYADARHHNKGFGANLLPSNYTIDATGVITVSTATPGEWVPSEMQIPSASSGSQGQTQSRELIAVGPNYPGLGASGFDAVSCIEGYAASRGLPNVLDPNAPGDAADVDGFNPDNWMAATFNEGTRVTEQVIDELLDSNNIAPYPFENDGVHTDTQYPGGANQLNGMEIHDFSIVSPTTVGGVTRVKGGMFPCGLIAFDWAPSSQSGNIVIQIDLVPGHHRGYLCEPMTEM